MSGDDIVVNGATYRQYDGEWFEVESEYRRRFLTPQEHAALAEIERLRAAGDAMAEALDALCHSYCGNEDDADLVDAWQEARRER